MREFVEYVCIVIGVGADVAELENHLCMNGYDFGIDQNRNLLFVYEEEIEYVETILSDRDITYEVKEC